MNTHLGMCRKFNVKDIDEKLLMSSSFLYFTGYMWDTDSQKEAIQKAVDIARSNNLKICFDVADPFVVEKNREEFLEFIKNNVDYFSNLKNKNYLTLIITFFFFVVIWVLLLGFGSPVALASGFIFGKWIGTILIATSLSVGSLLLYLITIFFFKDLVHQKLGNRMIFLKELF